MAFTDLFVIENPLVVYIALAALIFLASFSILNRLIDKKGPSAIAGLIIGLLSLRYFFANGITFENIFINFIVIVVLLFCFFFLFLNLFIKNKTSIFVVAAIISVILSYYLYIQEMLESDRFIIVVFWILVLGVIIGIAMPLFRGTHRMYRRY